MWRIEIYEAMTIGDSLLNENFFGKLFCDFDFSKSKIIPRINTGIKTNRPARINRLTVPDNSF